MASKTFDRRALPAGAAFSSWSAGDGWALRRLDWRQPEAREARGSLLFAGGRGDFIEKYLEADAHWFGRGWNVTAFDWRGQGGSRGGIEGGHLDSLDRLVDDLAGLIEAWLGEGPGPHVVIGHSMGGHVLLRTLAERHPEIDAAVLVAPMLMINSAPLPPWSAAWAASMATLFGLGRVPAWHQPETPAPAGSLRQSYLTGCRERYEDEAWWWQKEPGYNLGAPSWGWLRAAYRSCETLTPEALRGVDVPVLLLGTDRDRLVSPAAIRRAAELVPAAELVMINEAAHEILREEDPIRLRAFAAIDAFLDARAPR
jgi:lysophospholipase